MRARKRLLVPLAWIVVAGLAGGLVPGCGAQPRRVGGGGGGDGLRVGLIVETLDFTMLDLGTWRGQPVVVHVFATWSAASQSDHDLLAPVARDGRAKVVAIGVDPDGARLLVPYRDVLRPPFPIALAPEGLLAGQTVLGPLPVVPTTIVLDDEGREVVRLEGGLTARSLDAALDRAGARGPKKRP